MPWGARAEAQPSTLLVDVLESQNVREQTSRGLRIGHVEADPVKGPYCVFERDARKRGRSGRRLARAGSSHQLQDQPVGVLESHDVLTEALLPFHAPDAGDPQAIDPELRRPEGHAEGGEAREPRSTVARHRPLPRKERHDGPGCTDPITVVEVVGTRIVEVDGALHQAEA